VSDPARDISAGSATPLPARPARGRRLEAACLACVAACAAWALWPLDRSGSTATAGSAAPARPAVDAPAASFDLAAFRTPLWVAPIPPPAPPAPPPPPPPPPPLRLQLIGIVAAASDGRHPGTLSAVIFDPDTGRLHTVGPGAPVGRAIVERVAAGAVSVREGALVRELRLRPAEGRP